MLSFIAESVADNQNPYSVSSRFRKKRFTKFLTEFNINSQTTILDVGGTSHTWAGTGLEKNVVLLNLVIPRSESARQHFRYVQGNALNMHMFEENHFDVVFSNSVIEHVGSFENQHRFAEEVSRVGKAYWVQTPNKQFPVEPHLLFPFFQFLPAHLQKEVALRWKYSHYKKWGKTAKYIVSEVSNTRLMNRSELAEIFEDAHIYKEKLLGIIKSIVACKKRQVRYPLRSGEKRKRTVA